MIRVKGVPKQFHKRSDFLQLLVERFNSTLADMIAKLVSSDQSDWDKSLSMLQWSYNSSVHATTGFSPYEILFGVLPRSPFDMAFVPPVLSNNISPSVFDYVSSLRERLVAMRSLVIDNTRAAQDQYTRAYNARHRDVVFDVGDSVYLFTPRPRKGESPKIQSLWTGPFTVVERVNDINYVIERPDHPRQLVGITRLKPAVTRHAHLLPSGPADNSSSPSANAPVAPSAPAPLPDTNPPVLPSGRFVVDSLLDRARSGRGYRYLVHWLNYPSSEDSWEPRGALPRDMVNEFDRQHPFNELRPDFIGPVASADPAVLARFRPRPSLKPTKR